MTDRESVEILKNYDPCAHCPSNGYDCQNKHCVIVEALTHAIIKLDKCARISEVDPKIFI